MPEPGGTAATAGPASAAAIRVVLADDSVLFREGLARVLAENGFIVAGQAGDADGLHAAVEREMPDVVVTDIRMPPTNTNEGLLAAQRIRAEHPGTGVLVLSQYVETRQAVRLLQNAPHRIGYLLKDRVSDIAEFTDAVRRIARGGSVIDPEVVAQLLRRRGEGWACCRPPTTTGESWQSSPTSEAPDGTPWRAGITAPAQAFLQPLAARTSKARSRRAELPDLCPPTAALSGQGCRAYRRLGARSPRPLPPLRMMPSMDVAEAVVRVGPDDRSAGDHHWSWSRAHVDRHPGR